MDLLDRVMYSPFLAQLVVTRRCNLSCGYCNEFDRISPPVDASVLTARLDHLKDLGTFSVELTGGEPMLHPQIYDLIRYARTRSFHKVMMISNAFLLSAEKVKKLNEAGLMELQVSVDGVTPNETTVKVLKAMRPKLQILAKYARFPVVMSAVLGAAQASEVLTVVRTAKALGFTPRVLVLHDGSGQIRLSADELSIFDEVKQELGGRRYEEARDYRTRLLRDGVAPFRCRAGSRYLYVDEFGDVHWCSQTRGIFQRPLATYSLSDLKKQFYTQKDCAPACTLGCARTQSAYDEWRAQPSTFSRPRRLPLQPPGSRA